MLAEYLVAKAMNFEISVMSCPMNRIDIQSQTLRLEPRSVPENTSMMFKDICAP